MARSNKTELNDQFSQIQGNRASNISARTDLSESLHKLKYRLVNVQSLRKIIMPLLLVLALVIALLAIGDVTAKRGQELKNATRHLVLLSELFALRLEPHPALQEETISERGRKNLQNLLQERNVGSVSTMLAEAIAILDGSGARLAFAVNPDMAGTKAFDTAFPTIALRNEVSGPQHGNTRLKTHHILWAATRLPDEDKWVVVLRDQDQILRPIWRQIITEEGLTLCLSSSFCC